MHFIFTSLLTLSLSSHVLANQDDLMNFDDFPTSKEDDEFFNFSLDESDKQITYNSSAPIKPITKPIKTSSDPNPSARMGTKELSNVFATAELIYFKPLIENIATSKATSLLPTQTAYTYVTPKWAPGLRASLGYNMNFGDLDVVLSYTGLRYKHINTYAYITPQTYDLHGTLSYSYSFNLGDFDLGRMYSLSSKLKLRPHMGIRGLALTQRGSINSTELTGAGQDPSGTSYSFVNKIHSVLFGLEGGADLSWMIAREFSLYTNLGIASLVNAQTTSETYTNAYASLSDTQDSEHHRCAVIQALDLAIGLQWDRHFYDSTYHLGINLGYEQHNYVNLNKNMTTSPNSTLYPVNLDTDFCLQGITVGARFDF